MKKLLSVLMALAVLLSCTAVSFAEESGTATIVVSEDVSTRGGGNGGTYQGNAGLIVGGTPTDTRTAYFKFNVSELRTAIGGKEAKYTFSITTNGDRTNATGATVYLYGLDVTEWSELDLTHNMSATYGMYDDVSNEIGTLVAVGKNTTFSVDITDYIQSLPSNITFTTIKIQNIVREGSGALIFHSKDTTDAAYAPSITATRTFREGSEEVFNGIELPEITDKNIILPTTGDIYGSKIVWTSSHPEIITADGVVTRGTKNVKVALTANYEGYSDVQKTFYVIVPKSGDIMTVSDYPAEDTFTREGGKYSGWVMGGMLASGAGGAYKSYIKFDVSKIRKDLNYRDAKYTLQVKTKSDCQGGLVNVYGINGTNRYDWSEDSLTFNLSAEKGINNDVSNKIGEINTAAGEGIYTVDVTDYINSVIELDNIGTIKLQNPDCTTTVTFYDSENETEENRPLLIAERTYKELDYDIFDGIIVPDVATENIELPTISLTDEEINWASSNPQVIAIDGTVTRQENEAVVTLTVSGDNKTKTFDVVVPKIGDTGTFTKVVSEDIFTRGNKYGAVSYPGQTLHVAHDARGSFLKFDLSDLRASMNGKDAKYTLNLTTAGDSCNAEEGSVFIYGLSYTDWSEENLTHNLASEYGMYYDISNKIGEMTVVGQNKVFTVDITDYINSVSADARFITIKLENTVSGGTGTTVFESKDSNAAAAPSITATRTYKDDYSNGINPVIYVNGKASDTLNAGVAKARVAFVNNNVTTEAKGTLIMALYNGDVLCNIKSVSLDFVASYVNDMSVSVDVPAGEGYSVKAFVVNGNDSISPLANSVELK